MQIWRLFAESAPTRLLKAVDGHLPHTPDIRNPCLSLKQTRKIRNGFPPWQSSRFITTLDAIGLNDEPGNEIPVMPVQIGPIPRDSNEIPHAFWKLQWINAPGGNISDDGLAGATWLPVFIFDQFEEIFTLGKHVSGLESVLREDYFAQLAFQIDSSFFTVKNVLNIIYDNSRPCRKVVLKGHQGPVLSAVFSPDGKRILTASSDNTAKLWPGLAETISEWCQNAHKEKLTITALSKIPIELSKSEFNTAVGNNIIEGTYADYKKKFDFNNSSK